VITEECSACKDADADSCVESLEIEGDMHRRVVYGADRREVAELCHDCGVGRGGYHHLSCDVEKCPVCGSSQLLWCGHIPLDMPAWVHEAMEL
jgi:hypothetical protein